MVRFWICVFQLRSWLTSSPKYLAWSTASRTGPCRTYWCLIDVWARVICSTWHLLGLNSISQSFSQISSLWRSCWRVWQSALLLIVKYTTVSSANNLTSEWMFSGRSLIYKRNKIGPKTEPWGTPDVTGISDDFSPSKATHWVCPSKKALIQLRFFRITPCWCSLYSNFVWLTLSKALLKSRRIRSVWWPWGEISCNLIDQLYQLCFAGPPFPKSVLQVI